MMNINEGDADLGIGSIRSRVVGAGVNAESGRELSFSASDPLSELVYSSHKGLSLKFASSRTADKKPFLLWNVNKAWGTPPDDMFVDKAAHSDDNLQAQKENNMLISPKSRALWDENDRSRDSAAGLKRQGYVKDVTHETKRIKNQIPLCFGSTSSWISNMGRSSIDVNLHQNFIDAQDSASLIFQSTLSCKDMNILNTGEEKEKDSIEESIQLMVDDNKTLSLSKQIIVCDNQARTPDESFAGQMNYADNQARSEKCKVIIQETSTSNLDSGMNVVFPTDEKNLESRDDSQVNQKCSTNSEVSVDVKSKFGSSEALAMRLGAFRHITPLENNVKNEYQKSPLYDIVPAQNTVKLSEIFQAIQNLRLSRADILRWMNSDMPLSHLNGFFLRLRLRKLEQGLKGTRYYVACISAGEGREVSGCTSNKSIMVDVGGIKSCITSHYVSNHDFLQDEIKAWWCRAVNRGCRVPSLDELNSKFSKRTSLGF